MAKATALKGRSLMVFISNGTSLIPVALSTNCTISLNTETSDSKTKDDGVWGAQEISGLTWEISNESLHTVDTRTIDWTFDALFAKYTAAEPVNICFGVPSNYTTEGLPDAGWTSPGTYTGKALITSLELSGSVGDNATVTVSMTGVGELEKAS